MAKKFNSKEAKREFDRYRKRVARLNAYIDEVVRKVGSNEVYLDKSSTIISAPDSVWPFEEVPVENPEKEVRFQQKYVFHEYVYKSSGTTIEEKVENYTISITWEYDEESDEWYAQYHGSCFDFDEDIQFVKRCVRNGLRFWQSEDPDRFLEQDDDEEGGEL